MLRLTQTFGAHAGRVREIDQAVIRFGRLPSNDFAFDAHADLDASGQHAEIRREGPDWVLCDTGSRNGTLLDGRPIQRQVLRGGEEIEFGAGGPRVRVEVLGPAPARGMPTAPATAIDAPSEESGARSLPGEVLSPAPGALPSSPFAAGPPLPSSVPPSVRPPPPSQPPPSDKKYGQKTVDAMLDAALARAQAQQPATPPPAGSPVNTHFIRNVATEEAARRSRWMGFAVAAVVVLFVLVLCAVSGLVAFLASRAYGGPL